MDLITESITENGETKVVSQYMHEQIYDLAKDIASFPGCHDELEILIADRIKRFVHQEKASVYERVLEYAKFDDSSGHIKWLISNCLEPKVETHNELAQKWEYGTKYSCADQMREK